MSIKDQVTKEQWKQLVTVPGMASTFVSIASGGPLEVANEVFTASKFSAELSFKEGGSGYGELVDEILVALRTMTLQEAKENAIVFKATDAAGARAELKQYIIDAFAVAETLPGKDGFNKWIIDMVTKVAETKTGGVLGIGAKSVIDERELAAISELRSMLSI